MVRPLVSKLSVTTTGRSVVIAPCTAASTSSAADMVSIQSTSAPPAANACACSAKAAAASSMVSGPRGTISSPVGPIEPATTTGRPAASATPRATRAAAQVQLGHPLLGLVQLQPMPAAAEAVGQDDVSAGLDEAAMHGRDPLGMPDVPQLRAVAGRQAQREQAGTHPTVGEQHRPRREQRIQGRHGQTALTLARRRGRLSAGLVRPTARRRSRSSCRMSSRSGVSAYGQRAISCVVRMQPSHRRRPTSRRQTPIQGDGMSLEKLTRAPGPRHLQREPSDRKCRG